MNRTYRLGSKRDYLFYFIILYYLSYNLLNFKYLKLQIIYYYIFFHNMFLITF